MDKLKNYLLTTACLVILVGALTLFSPVVQQVQGDPPRRVELIEFVAESVQPGQTRVLFVVPAGFHLVITDVIVSNNISSGVFLQRLLRDRQTVLSLGIPFSEVYTNSFVSGIQFDSGETMSVTHAATVGNTTWNLQGFLKAN